MPPLVVDMTATLGQDIHAPRKPQETVHALPVQHTNVLAVVDLVA